MFLGRQAYLEAKAEGESSMPGKARCDEAAKSLARRGSDDMVKAGMLQPKYPICKVIRTGYGGYYPGLFGKPIVWVDGFYTF